MNRFRFDRDSFDVKLDSYYITFSHVGSLFLSQVAMSGRDISRILEFAVGITKSPLADYMFVV